MMTFQRNFRFNTYRTGSQFSNDYYFLMSLINNVWEANQKQPFEIIKMFKQGAFKLIIPSGLNLVTLPEVPSLSTTISIKNNNFNATKPTNTDKIKNYLYFNNIFIKKSFPTHESTCR